MALGRVHVCNDIPCDIPECNPTRTYVRTYILGEDRSSMQSIALMHSAKILSFTSSHLLVAVAFVLLDRVLKYTWERKEMSPDLVTWMVTVPIPSETKMLAFDRVTCATGRGERIGKLNTTNLGI